ncbi:GntR family transcriptional regulator [Microvirga sp. GCM10011540]|uniref:GntR family transcriptional regulator n=1 Tax=Microvirga sp. GCM10011540 TaxID=3317338 RepID=UPI00361B4E39
MDEATAGRDGPNLREKAYDRFTHHLLARDIRPGQFVSQRQLMELTGLSLAAIRELVPRLESEGLIRTVPQRGMQIAHVDLNLIRDAFQFRLFMEREAVAIFTAEASDAALARLRQDHESIVAEAAVHEESITPDLVARAQAVDWDLHWTIIAFLGNAIIADAYRVNSIKVRLIRQEQTLLSEALIMPVMREHLAVIEAIETRDPAKAVAAIDAHINSARSRALGLR